jgi:hypothetical protein
MRKDRTAIAAFTLARHPQVLSRLGRWPAGKAERLAPDVVLRSVLRQGVRTAPRRG